MDNWKNILKQLGKIFIYAVFFNLILTILYYFNIIDSKLCSYIRLIGFIIIIYFNSTTLSRKINNKLFLNGLLLGISIILILFIASLLMGQAINLKLIIYYLLILGVSILGSSRKKKSKKKYGY